MIVRIRVIGEGLGESFVGLVLVWLAVVRLGDYFGFFSKANFIFKPKTCWI
jgi:hypothetical protein